MEKPTESLRGPVQLQKEGHILSYLRIQLILKSTPLDLIIVHLFNLTQEKTQRTMFWPLDSRLIKRIQRFSYKLRLQIKNKKEN
jgi:hypothetical protein